MPGICGAKGLEISQELDYNSRLREAPGSKEPFELRDALLVFLPRPRLGNQSLLIERVNQELRKHKDLLIEFRLRVRHRHPDGGQQILVGRIRGEKEEPTDDVTPGGVETLVRCPKDQIRGLRRSKLRQKAPTIVRLADLALRRYVELLPMETLLVREVAAEVSQEDSHMGFVIGVDLDTPEAKEL